MHSRITAIWVGAGAGSTLSPSPRLTARGATLSSILLPSSSMYTQSAAQPMSQQTLPSYSLTPATLERSMLRVTRSFCWQQLSCFCLTVRDRELAVSL